MIKPAALGMAAVMAAITAGTYYGLDLLPPGTLPPPIGRVVDKEPTPVVDTTPPPAVASAAPVQPAPAPAAAQPAPTEQDLAEEPPQQPAATPAPAAPAPEAKPAPAPAEAKATPAPAAAKPEPKSAPAETAAAPAPEPAPAAKPAPAPKAAKPKAKPAAKPAPSEPTTVASAEKPAAKPAPAKSASPPDADVIKPWWPDASKMPADQLKLMYAGQVQGQEAIALLFSAPLAIDSVKQHATIKGEGGEAATGEWELGKNPRLAVFKGLKPGRYTVVLQPEVADQKGFMLGQTLQGPVYVKEALKLDLQPKQ